MPDVSKYDINGNRIHGRVYKTFKWIGILLLFSLILFLLMRSLFSTPSDVNDLLLTDKAADILQSSGADGFIAYNIKRSGSFGDGNMFHISNIIYFESDHTLQFTLRYNIKKTDKLTEGYYADSEERSYKYPALNFILSDSESYESPPLFKYASQFSYYSQKGNNYYERIIFDNVNLDYAATTLQLSVYLIDTKVAETKVFDPDMTKKKTIVTYDYQKVTLIHDTKRN